MVKDLSKLLKQTFKGSCIVIAVGIILTILFYANYNYAYVFVIGSIVSLMNFIASATVTKYLVESNNNFKGMVLIISFVIRIIIIAVIGLLLALQNKYYLIPYIIGYMSNFISLFMAIKSQEERK